MNKKININLITLICVFLSHFLNAQNSVDSTAIYFDLKKYDKAIEFGKNDYFSLVEYGLKLFSNKDYENALPFLLKGYEIGENSLNNDDKIYIKSYIGVLYLSKSDYKNAIINLEFAIKLQESLYGINGQNYLEFQNVLAYTYKSNREYLKAENLYIKNIEIVKKGLLIKDKEFITSLNGLADIYSDKGELEKSETFYFQALDVVKEIFGEKNHYYVLTLKNIASLYGEQGRFTKSEEFYFKTKAIVKEIDGENNLEYALLLMDLAGLYKAQYKYYLAEPLLIEALAIRKEISGERNDFYISTLTSLAQLYNFQGKNEKSEMIYLKSLSLTKEIFGEKNPKYADALNDLANFYADIDYYSKAERLYKEASEIIKETLGNKHPDYIASLNDLANFYVKGKNFTEAQNIFSKLLEYKKEIYGEDTSEYAFSSLIFGSLYLSQDKFSQAEELFLRSLEIYKKIYGEKHRLYVANLSILANLYRRSNINSKAANFYERYLISNRDKIINDLYSSSENELINYNDIFLKNEMQIFSSPLSFISNFPDLYPKININAYNNEILIKNISIRNKELIKNSIKKNSNESIKTKYDKYLNNKVEINKNKELSLVNRPKNFESLIIETDLIEKELIKESVSFSDFKKIISISWEDIKSKLNENDISINIFQYLSAENKMKYSVFLVKSHSKYPKIISLFEENQLELLISSKDETIKSNKIDSQYSNKLISDLFLKPLEIELIGVNNIYLSLSGLGHQINFAALPINSTQNFGEKYKLHILNSPAELIDYKVASLEKKSKIELLLFGGIDYTESKGNISMVVNENTISSNENFINTAKRSGIEALPGTLKEVDGINSNANKSGFNSKIYKESEATEESIKALDGKTTPFVLHLATHGFFFPDPVQEISKDIVSSGGKSKILKALEDPMMRSGLLLAGAKNYWGKSNPNNTIEDGILTANEISNLDLSACQLVVLSACETGLGDVKGSEGVFGLQRAFKMAGVKNIIMSLWKVPDTQTAELFDIFYSECFAGKTIHEAFRSAQSQMKAKYSPYYWAGFVLLE
ncbi:CHAT domain-containing protein [Flavobacterium sp.]|uniref:CHAT domain-containing protein n=1 Tax=Flavobacterium sp. TaxID=239 RepID=UPI00261C0DCD|nr:CHAT domain-containing protein [Flavobacterium sp.]